MKFSVLILLATAVSEKCLYLSQLELYWTVTYHSCWNFGVHVFITTNLVKLDPALAFMCVVYDI